MHTFRPHTRFIGQYFKHLEEVGSTNDWLMQASEDLPDGALVIADCQNAGKGQNGRVWQAASGQHLTFSLLVKPAFLLVAELYALNMAIAISVSTVIEAYIQEPVVLKWPNDFYVRSRKLGGVLIETNLQGGFVRQAIIGIGINLNQPMSDNYALRAISVIELLGKSVSRWEVLEQLAYAIEMRYLMLEKNGSGTLLMEYQRKLLGYQEKKWFLLPDETMLEGMIMGVNSSGNLLVRHAGGLFSYPHGAIKMLFDDEVAID